MMNIPQNIEHGADNKNHDTIADTEKVLVPGRGYKLESDLSRDPRYGNILAVVETSNKARKDGALTKDGDVLLVLDMQYAEKNANGFPTHNGQAINPSVRYMVVDPSSGGYKGLRNGESFSYGRPVKEQTPEGDPRWRFTEVSPLTSRNHVEFSVDDNGDIFVKDMDSMNGTTVNTGYAAYDLLNPDRETSDTLPAVPDMVAEKDIDKEVSPEQEQVAQDLGHVAVEAVKTVSASEVVAVESDSVEADSRDFEPFEREDRRERFMRPAVKHIAEVLGENGAGGGELGDVLRSIAKNPADIRRALQNIDSQSDVIQKLDEVIDLRFKKLQAEGEHFHERVQRNDEKNMKVTDAAHGHEQRMASADYVRELVKHKLSGRFDAAKSRDRSDIPADDPGNGQHRQAAEKILDSFKNEQKEIIQVKELSESFDNFRNVLRSHGPELEMYSNRAEGLLRQVEEMVGQGRIDSYELQGMIPAMRNSLASIDELVVRMRSEYARLEEEVATGVDATDRRLLSEIGNGVNRLISGATLSYEDEGLSRFVRSLDDVGSAAGVGLAQSYVRNGALEDAHRRMQSLKFGLRQLQEIVGR